MKQFIKNNYGKTGCIITLLLTTFCGITLSGCGDEDVSLITLLNEPEQYKGDEIQVYGYIVDRSELQGDSLLVMLAVDDSVDASSVICEFPKDEGRNLSVDGKGVTISGTVDIVAGITFLRECRLVE